MRVWIDDSVSNFFDSLFELIKKIISDIEEELPHVAELIKIILKKIVETFIDYPYIEEILEKIKAIIDKIISIIDNIIGGGDIIARNTVDVLQIFKVGFDFLKLSIDKYSGAAMDCEY